MTYMYALTHSSQLRTNESVDIRHSILYSFTQWRFNECNNRPDEQSAAGIVRMASWDYIIFQNPCVNLYYTSLLNPIILIKLFF